jgi:hypothetical protein
MKTLLVCSSDCVRSCCFWYESYLSKSRNKEIVPVVEILPEPEPEPVVEEKTDPELICLAMNIYHEARNQSIAGQMAVALVTINRVNDIDIQTRYVKL